MKRRKRNRKPNQRYATAPSPSGQTPASKRVDNSRTPLLAVQSPNSQRNSRANARRVSTTPQTPKSPGINSPSYADVVASPSPMHRQPRLIQTSTRGVSFGARLDDAVASGSIAAPVVENDASPLHLSCTVSRDCLKALFLLVEKDPTLQKQWWPLQSLVEMTNRLNRLFFLADIANSGNSKAKQYQTGQVLSALRKDCPHLVAESMGQVDSNKRVFLQTYKINNKRCSAVFIDLALGASESLDYTPPHDPRDWFEGLFRKRHSLIALLPLELFEKINPWYGGEFEKIFLPRDGETALEAAQHLHDLLEEAQQSSQAVRELTKGLQNGERTYYIAGICDEDDDPVEVMFDAAAVERLVARNRERAMYMRKALEIVLDADPESNPKLTWGRCCQEAVESIQACTRSTKLKAQGGGRTVETWFRSFKVERLFENPLLHEKHGISFFINNPSSVRSIREYGNNNLATLSIDLMHDFVHEQEIPRLISMRKEGGDTATAVGLNKEMLLKESGLKMLCPNTIHNWMRFLGFKRDLYRKGFYTDNHERPDVVKHRIQYCLEYLTLELRSNVWVQLSVSRRNELLLEKRVYDGNNGHMYKQNGADFVEYHVDDIKDAHMLPELDGCRLGGRLSVRKPTAELPVMMWGQDEVVCHEKQQSSMVWYGAEGQAPVRSKDRGAAFMISGFVSRELGWMPDVSENQLKQINLLRKDKQYLAEEAAQEVFGRTDKQPFTSEDVNAYCFRWSIAPGVNRDGYWNNSYALVQLENVMDVVNILMPGYQHVAYFDHSQGHKAKRKDGLDVGRLNKDYGGKQPIIRDTVLDATCIGTHSNKGLRLAVGSTQRSHFVDADQGPAWMDAAERLDKKYDRVFEGETISRTLRTKIEIYGHLKTRLPSDVNMGSIESLTVASMRELSKRHSVSLSVTEQKTQKGWLGAPKGTFQLCAERGLIDVSKGFKYYTKDGRKDKDGAIIPGTSLVELLSACGDFKNEVSMLEWVATQYGWILLYSPKCHPEIAGIGVEYDWATSKNVVNRTPLCERRGLDKFKNCILNHCFSREILTDQVVRNNARQMRGYMIGYLMMHASLVDKDSAVDEEGMLTGTVSVAELEKTVDHIPCEKIKKARKCYKRHRGIAVFEASTDGTVSYRLPEKL